MQIKISYHFELRFNARLLGDAKKAMQGDFQYVCLPLGMMMTEVLRSTLDRIFCNLRGLGYCLHSWLGEVIHLGNFTYISIKVSK
jgi:hypothetical protein